MVHGLMNNPVLSTEDESTPELLNMQGDKGL
jgi:hypothetical protein